MRIGIEAQRIFRKNKHGMDYVVLEEIKQLQQMDTKNEYFVFVAPGPDPCLEESANVHIIKIKGICYPIWEQIALPQMVSRLKLDLLHCTSNTAPILCSVPLVLTLHDIIFLEPRDKHNHSLYQNMGWFYRRLVVPRILKKCRRIITVSAFERNNIIHKLSLPEKQVQLIYNGYNEWFHPTTDKEAIYRKYMKERGYLFFLGNTDPKKNTERTLVAYSQYLQRSQVKRQLLMADLDQQYLEDIIKRNHLENIHGHIVMSGYIPNSDLPYVYSGAFAFLYTSLRESFGIPLLEAMACGTPVITSNTSSMPEIAGSDALLVNPENTDEICKALLSLEEHPDCHQQQVKYGLHRATLFSWRHTAEQLLNLYDEIYGETRH
jgi:glycosyltransferase involved in cell wall biosynthesis